MSTSFPSDPGSLAPFGSGTMMGNTAAIKKGDRVFDRFKLQKILGVGGMGVVWLAQDTKLDQLVALKFIPEALRHDPDAINDLKVQTKLGLRLTHNNIVRVLGFEDDEQLAAIVMEYVDGATLSAMRVDQPSQVFEAESLHVYLLHILDALEYAHEQERIVHRDLKPANVMVNSEDRIKVADFGIACSLRNSVGRVLSMPQRSSSGTLHYMSPQQLLGSPASVADDIYSLGATAFDLLTGTPPFHSGDVQMQIREIPATTMTQRRHENQIEAEEIPDAWETVVGAALSKDVSLRPSNVAEFRKGLLGQPFKRGAGSKPAASSSIAVPAFTAQAAKSAEVRSSGRREDSRKSSSSIKPIWAITAGVGVVAAVVLYLIVNHSPEADLAQGFADQQSRVEAFEKGTAATAAKLAKWDKLLDDLRAIDYHANPRLRSIVNRAEDRSDYLKQKLETERQDYLFRVQALRTTMESTRKESESKELGAGAKAELWNQIGKEASSLSLLDQGHEHEAILLEAQKSSAAWEAKAAQETPTTIPPENLVYAKSQAATWAPAGKKKLLQDVQTSLTQQGFSTGSTDGIWNPQTFQALVAWQKEQKLPASGVLDLPTLNRLGLQLMQEPAKPQGLVTGNSSSEGSKRSSSQGASSNRSGGGSSSSGSSGGGSGMSWEDVAKRRAFQGGSLPFRPPGMP